MILTGRCGESQEAVDPCDEGGIDLNCRDIVKDIFHQGGIDPVLQGDDLLLRPQYLLLIHFQLLGDVALGAYQRLLTDPTLRYLLLVGVTNLDVIAEDIVEGHFQRRYPGAFALALLDLHQVILAAVGNLPQFIKFSVNSFADESTLVHQCRRIGGDLFINAYAQRSAGVHLPAHLLQALVL